MKRKMLVYIFNKGEENWRELAMAELALMRLKKGKLKVVKSRY